MAFLDIAASISYGRYNIKFARMVGLNTAVYWSCIMNVLEMVREKNTYDSNGFFTLNRSYVERQTSLSTSKQAECDAALIKLGLLEIDAVSKKMRCDIRKFFGIITEEDTTEIKEISKMAKSSSKEGKAEGKKIGVINRLTNIVRARLETRSPDLMNLYIQLLEACYDKGLQSNAQLDLFMDTIENYTSDLAVQEELVKIGIALAYRDATWCINKYESKFGRSQPATKTGAPQQTADSVDTSITF